MCIDVVYNSGLYYPPPTYDACPYDIGDILQTKNNKNPSERWPGTEWTAIETFLLGVSETHPIGTTGGEEEHALTVEELATHDHNTISTGQKLLYDAATSTKWGSPIQNNISQYVAGLNGSFRTSSTGSGSPHNNMPPYTSIYIWERTK